MPKSYKKFFERLDSRDRLACNPDAGRKKEGFAPTEFVKTKEVIFDPIDNL